MIQNVNNMSLSRVKSIGVIILVCLVLHACNAPDKSVVLDEKAHPSSDQKTSREMNADHVVSFTSLNLKLVVIDELLNKGHFKEEVAQLKAKYWNPDDITYKPIPEILAYFQELRLTQHQLSEVEQIIFDGGNEIYQIIAPSWDGEDDQFDVKDISDLRKLENLREIHCLSMVYTNQYETLLDLPRLQTIHDWHDLSISETAIELKKKGITFK